MSMDCASSVFVPFSRAYWRPIVVEVANRDFRPVDTGDAAAQVSRTIWGQDVFLPVLTISSAYSGATLEAMAHKPKQAEPKDDERIKIPLDPEVALRALLKVDPDAEPVEATDAAQRPDAQ